MDTFTERMLERTQRRQELLASASLETPIPNKTIETSKLEEPVVTSLSPPKSPITRHQRRTRLAELASRVDQWLEEDQVLKPNEKNSKTIETKKAMSTNHTNKQQVNVKPKSVSFVCPTSTIEKTKTLENKSPLKQQPKPQINYNTRLQQLRQKEKSPEKNTPLQWQSPNLAAATMTVAQRRALFEKNISAQQNAKPTTTTIVTISLTKTTPVVSTTATVIAGEENNKPVSGITTPPHPIPISLSTPPSRRGTRPRMSPAVAAASIGNLSTQKRCAWTPPCIKNVLLKKQLHKELDDEQQKMPEGDITATAVATSSPLDDPVISPADRIAMSVGRVRFKSPSPNTSLYPDLSLVEDSNDNSDKETVTSSSESQLIGGCKRRSNGNHALNSSTTSSESVCQNDENTEILGAKRSRCESNINDFEIIDVAKDQEDLIMESSLNTPITTTTTTYECNNSSVLSTASLLSLPSTSFTYYPSLDKSQHINENDNGLQLVDNYLGSSGDQQGTNTRKNIDNEPPLVHSVSIYRKQQQLLRSSGTPSSKPKPGQGDMRSALLQQPLMLLEDDENYDNEDDDEDMLQELETAAARAWHLERTVVPEQDRIIEQATQALNICDVYRQRSGLRPEFSSKFSPEHVHAERLLLIAGLRRTDAVREAQRLRVERTLLPGGTPGKSNRHLNIVGNGKTLVIESLRVPILSSVINRGNNKNKYSAIEGMENQTRWPGGYRYFVCAVRAAATICRPPMTAATRPADALEESVRRFSVDTYCSDDGISYGYVEFITKKQVKSSGTRKCVIPSEAEGAPIMISGLDNNGWKITVELYGLSPTATGDLEHHNSNSTGKEHDTHENKSVLDKLWSTVKTPNKDSKKLHGSTASTCIESPGGPTAVRNTVFRQLGYFIFSDGQVDRQQFTLNKVHQSGGISSTTTRGTVEETVRVRMRLLEEGEDYAYENVEGVEGQSASGYTSKKLLTLPPECKQTEGFLTLFDDHELRSTSVIDRGQQWQRRSDIAGGSSAGTTLWRRLWFRVEIIDDPQKQKINDDKDEVSKLQLQNKNIGQQQTIVLRYWMYPEHAEQQRQPLGAIDLSLCLSPQTNGKTTNDASSHKPAPAAPAPSDLCARPNTLRLLLYNNDVDYDNDHEAIMNGIDDPLLLSADTADERREWCDTVNAAVSAISEHRKWIRLAEATRFKQEQQDKEHEHQLRRQQEQQRTGAWPTASFGSGKSSGKKKKLYK